MVHNYRNLTKVMPFFLLQPRQMVRTDVEVIATDYMFSFLSANRTSYTCASPPGLELIQLGGKTCSDRPTGLLRSAQKFKLRKSPLKVIREADYVLFCAQLNGSSFTSPPQKLLQWSLTTWTTYERCV